MSESKLKFEIDEYGRIGYRVTNEGVLLSKDEKEFIIDHVTRMQAENDRLRELVRDMYGFIESTDEDCGDVTFSDCFDYCKHDSADDGCCKTGECYYERRMRELGIEVSE